MTVDEFRSKSINEQRKIIRDVGKNHSFEDIRKLLRDEVYPDEPPQAHNIAHELGRTAIRQYGIEGFALCDSFLNFGCFHGAALHVVQQYGVEGVKGGDLWQACKDNTPKPGSCLHGLGHAIMILSQYDLMDAYKSCDETLSGESSDEKFWCYDGVSMENTSRTMQEENNYGKEGNLRYPCSIVPEKYKAACVRYHVGFIRKKHDFTLEETMDFCRSYASEEVIEECIIQVGSVEIRPVFNDHMKVGDRCEKAGKYYGSCIIGASNPLAIAGRHSDAEEICNTIESETDRQSCLNRLESMKKWSNLDSAN